MRQKPLFALGAACAVLLMLGTVLPLKAAACTEEELENAIEESLAWLATQQSPDGSWGEGGCDRVGVTSLVVLKYNWRALELEVDPLSAAFEYSDEVTDGLAYILANVHDQAISVEPAGDPDGNGNGLGKFFNNCVGNHNIYNTAIAMMAIATSQQFEAPYDLYLQDAVDYMAWAQEDPACGPHRGGWRYDSDSCDSDNSNSGYVTMGLGFAEAAKFDVNQDGENDGDGFGLTIPPFVKSELSVWIDVIQDDVNGDPNDGGSWYDPSNPWVNILKTGNLLFEMDLAGDVLGTQRVIDALDFIERHWYAPVSDVGWLHHRQAMFTMMKGLESLQIEFIDPDGDGVADKDWFDEVCTHLVATQNPDGSWPGDPWAGPVMSTAWAYLTLKKATVSPPPSAFMDIKPGSCPNPLNVTSRGVLPVAVLGREGFDVTDIDPASILLTRNGVSGGVAPIRWSYEDVGTPFEGEQCDCHDLNGDGFLDLSLKFSRQGVVGTLGLDEACGDTLALTLTGNLLSGEPIAAEDCVWLLKEICDNGIDDDQDGLVDSADFDCVPSACGTYPVAGPAVSYFLPFLLIPVGLFISLRTLRRKK